MTRHAPGIPLPDAPAPTPPRSVGARRSSDDSFGGGLKRAYRLVSACSWATGRDPEEDRRFADLLLGGGAPARTDSLLNQDGAPLQLCVALGRSAPRYRLLADPPLAASVRANGRTHLRPAGLDAVLDRTRTGSMRLLVSNLLDHMGASEVPPTRRAPRGAILLAGSPASSGIAVQLDATAHDQEEGWVRVGRWFGSVSDPLREAAARLEAARSSCRVAWVGVDGATPTRTIHRIVLQAVRPPPPGLFCHLAPRLDELARAGCFRDLLGGVALPPDELFFSLGFSQASGIVGDARVDISTASLGVSRNEITSLIEACCARLGLQNALLSTMTYLFNLEYSYLGLGVDESGRPCLCVHLKAAVD